MLFERLDNLHSLYNNKTGVERTYQNFQNQLLDFSTAERVFLTKVAKAGVKGYLALGDEIAMSNQLLNRSTDRVVIRSAGGDRVRIFHTPHAHSLLNGNIEEMKEKGFL